MLGSAKTTLGVDDAGGDSADSAAAAGVDVDEHDDEEEDRIIAVTGSGLEAVSTAGYSA